MGSPDAYPVPVQALNELSNYAEMEAELLALEAAGICDDEIAAILSEHGYRSTLMGRVLPSTVAAIRRSHGRFHRYRAARPRRVEGYLTVPQLAKALDFKPHWLYNLINRGVVAVERDDETGMYLFPDRAETIEDFRRLRAGAINHLSY